MRHPRRVRGFSLIELMIAVTLGLLAVAAVGSVFIYGSRSYKQDDKVSRMQDELRFAMAQLTQDLEMAGFYAQIRNLQTDIDVDSALTVGTDCGPPPPTGPTWVYDEHRALIDTLGNATGTAANAAFPCIPAADVAEGSDIVAIKRLGGSPVTTIESGKVYLKTNGVQSTIVKGDAHATTVPTSGAIETYELRPSVWFIRKFAVAGQNPPVPSLCRAQLQGGSPPTMAGTAIECLAQGIEEMHFEFGFDANANGVPDMFQEYGASPGVATMARVIAVRVHLLARASEVDVEARNNQIAKTFQLGPTRLSGPHNDGFYRKSLSSVVLLRNAANRLTPQELPQ